MNDIGTPERCVHCSDRHAEKEDFTYRGFHFCINCIAELVSWFMDSGFNDEPEMFDYVLEPGELERMTSELPAAVLVHSPEDTARLVGGGGL